MVGISDQFHIPVRYIGIGEGIDQLRIFDRREFVNALFGHETEIKRTHAYETNPLGLIARTGMQPSGKSPATGRGRQLPHAGR